MTKKQVVASFLYSIGRIALGLLLHPYQTVQSLTQETAFAWMVALPTLVFVLAKIVWLFVLVPVVRIVFSCSSTAFFGCDLIPFFANWLLLFCIYWQVIIVYLYLRFWIAFSD